MKRLLPTQHASARCRSLLAAVVLLCLFALSATAQTVTQNHIKYTITNSTKTAVATGTDGTYLQTIEIADSVKNSNGEAFPVVAVNASAFKNLINVKNVVFGSNLTKIGNSAFYGCSQLERVALPDGVEVIEANAFQNCAIRYAELPSTLMTLNSGIFKTNSDKHLDTLVVNTAYVDGTMRGLKYNSGAFNGYDIKNYCTLLVPSKAYEWYSANWGGYFARISAFGTAPSGLTVAPRGELQSFRDLSSVALTFNFADEALTDVLALGDSSTVEAALVLADGHRLEANAVQLTSNTLTLDFGAVLQQHRDLFIAPSEDVTTLDVRLALGGTVLLEGCSFDLAGFYAGRTIAWSVPLLPSVYDLPDPPVVTPAAPAQGNLYDYAAFQTVKLQFDGYTGLSLDAATGAYISARLYSDGELLAASQRAVVADDNTVALTFAIPADRLMVRRTSGISSYAFTVEVDGQVNMCAASAADASEARNYRFAYPSAAFGTPNPWPVRPVYFPEPTGVAIMPAATAVSLKDLTDVVVSFEGVHRVALATDAAALAPTASLYMEGSEMSRLGADRMKVEGNTLHLLFDSVDERLVTLITADKDRSYAFTMSLALDLMTDGYPCRVVIGKEPQATAPDATTSASGTTPAATAPYTQHWDAPEWRVDALTLELPHVAVGVATPADGALLAYDQLRVIELSIDNYQSVLLIPMDTAHVAAPAMTAHLLRDGRAVCAASTIETKGNKIVIDFGENLSVHAVGITPDDLTTTSVELALAFSGDLLFDGFPYYLVVDGTAADAHWSLQPVVVKKLPTPTVSYAAGYLSFGSEVKGVTYHYTITNPDGQAESEAVGTKLTTGGSSLVVPMQRAYTISVFTTREGYDGSDTKVVTLRLTGEPEVTEQ